MSPHLYIEMDKKDDDRPRDRPRSRSGDCVVKVILGVGFCLCATAFLLAQGFGADLALASAIAVAVAACWSFYVCKLCVHAAIPGTRKVITGLRGEPVCMGPGLRLALASPWAASPGAGPWRELSLNGAWPAPGAIVSFDPPDAQIQTAEGVCATVDVSVVCTVLDWENEAMLLKMVADHGSIAQRASALINQWACETLASVAATELTFSCVATRLNTTAKLASLNEKLRDYSCHLAVARVIVDANGVVLAADFAMERAAALVARQKMVAKETAIAKDGLIDAKRREIEAERASFDREQLRQTADFDREQLRQTADCKASLDLEAGQRSLQMATFATAVAAENAKAESHRCRALVDAGMDNKHVAWMIVAEKGAQALRESAASKIIVAPPESLGIVHHAQQASSSAFFN